MINLSTEQIRAYSEKLLAYIQASPTAFQAVETTAAILRAAGFTEIRESARGLAPGKYFLTRNASALLAFILPESGKASAINAFAAHTDSPTFKLKPVCEETVQKAYTRLNVERYGGMICSSFMDRPLSVAGRILVANGDGVKSISVHMKRDMAIIPNVAIHMNRNINEGMNYNPQIDMLPLIGGADTSLLGAIAAEYGVKAEEILSHDLFLFNRESGSIWGEKGEWISAPRLDDLMCAFAGLEALLDGTHPDTVPLLALFDNEEVGSNTRAGAASSLLSETVELIALNTVLAPDAMANSRMLSADNAHAVHPNHPEYADADNRPTVNGGIVLKFNAAQQYCTEAVSAALFRTVCTRSGIPLQTFANRSDMRGGSTLGNIAVTNVPFLAVDIGLAQLAMHSAYETAGTLDLAYMIEAAKAFYHSAVHLEADGSYTLQTVAKPY